MNYKRVRILNDQTVTQGPVVYWMSRDMRVQDNWGLVYAQEKAKENKQELLVVFCLREQFPFATERLVSFLLKGLEEVEQTLHELNIPFIFLLGDPIIEIPKFVKKVKAGNLVSDFSPLRIYTYWKQEIVKHIAIPFHEVDAHNIVPVWVASPKQEFGAYTLRPKLNRLLDEYLVDIPKIKKQQHNTTFKKTDWKKIFASIETDPSVPEVTWCTPGSKAAEHAMKRFLKTHGYAVDRNDPNKEGQSGLSPYLHFGHISAQRLALEVSGSNMMQEDKEAFLEELIIRRELSDNFCFYNKDYDTVEGFPAWAKKTHAEHAEDVREFVYTKKEFETAKTHDPLWNAAQNEMVRTGKMHGYMRMYWAKKILEWTNTPSVAMEIANYLNDRYELDGRDPNGYTGIAWSIGGVHDRAWFSRIIFGKIRFMSFNGAKSKFDVKAYITKYS